MNRTPSEVNGTQRSEREKYEVKRIKEVNINGNQYEVEIKHKVKRKME